MTHTTGCSHASTLCDIDGPGVVQRNDAVWQQPDGCVHGAAPWAVTFCGAVTVVSPLIMGLSKTHAMYTGMLAAVEVQVNSSALSCTSRPSQATESTKGCGTIVCPSCAMHAI
jgi:NO-binding membrane sensor protein with MHYT domain